MLYCYGENSFTFLLFQKLESLAKEGKPHPVCELLLGNCKSFVNGTRLEKKRAIKKVCEEKNPEIWLFPNFGKAAGFGEPDALVLAGGYSFWFEVETHFDFKRRPTDAKKSMQQLVRFHYFAQALKAGKQRRSKSGRHLAIMGPTIKVDGGIKDGILRVAGHSVLTNKGTLERLEESIVNKCDHYVIFSANKMKLTNKDSNRPREILNSKFDGLTRDIGASMKQHLEKECKKNVPTKPSKSRFWYQYYAGDFDRKIKIDDDHHLKYVPISS